ncbi:hypothetical protein [Streptomyces canus]|uniref:hypothetical protein n=1 Tax=Streptomyces canus TaxID=58343 RepID=UPI002DD9B964|nr:hypothetical protein [Streptomyces canus]WSD88289.1 hypothetical protein OG925_30205 [Streptomyces canus]
MTRLDIVEFDPQAYVSSWAVPMSSAAALRTPLSGARLIAGGKLAPAEEAVAGIEPA